MGLWFLAPDFTFTREGVIRLGTVLRDPCCPTLTLATKHTGLPADLPLPPEESIDEANHQHRASADVGMAQKLWARFLRSASASISASASRSQSQVFGNVDHEVLQFKHELGDACLKAIVAVPKVRKHIDSGFLSRKPVFVITAVRIAKTSFSVEMAAQTSISGEAEGSIGVDPQVGAGYTGDARRNALANHAYETAPGIVFAYRVHVIRVKGDGEVEEEMFSHKNAFMTGELGTDLEYLASHMCLGAFSSIIQFDSRLRFNSD
ncbi:hypothetical protein B0T14DRAFT_535360 [Immersiella caudata]|uniref:Uncharacterized protein n=1 Tax=Immersiella caudata TaxID=314043 RepID=A0AA39X5C8_9PEZI|nr:hypothetical protein B0T14DRAFT_535360 [Immersiella caudata]